MSSKGLLAAVLLTLMGAVWWVQIRTSPRPAERESAAQRASSAAQVAPNVALHRLVERRASAPTSLNGRDPFGRGGGASSEVADSSTGGVRRDGAALRDEQASAAAAAQPRLELIGVGAARTGAEGRVAVLAGERGVIHARAGDIVAGVYRIERVSDDAVEVRLVPENRVFTLRLR